MTPLKVALISTKDAWGQELARELRSGHRLSLRHLSSPDQLTSSMRDLDALILRFRKFRRYHLPLIYRLNTCYQSVGLVVVSDDFEQEALPQLAGYPSTAILRLQTEIKDIAAVIDRVHSGRHQSARHHPRVQMRQSAMVRDLGGYTFRGELLDVSQMGAKCRVHSSHFQQRTRVQLMFSDRYSKKMKRIEAVVAWQQRVQTLTRRDQLMGLRFLAES